MYNLCVKSGEGQLEPIDALEHVCALLTHGPCFFAHNGQWIKGKQQCFIGELVLATSLSIATFLESAIEQNDLQYFLIALVFEEQLKYVIPIYENEAMWTVRGKQNLTPLE